MKARTTQQLKDDLSRLTLERIGFDGSTVDQQSDEWTRMKLGVISASRAKDVIAPSRKAGEWGEARNSYLNELVGEVITGEKNSSFSSRATEWGVENERTCIALAGFELGVDIDTIPFVFRDDTMRAGCSPDGLIGDSSGIEVKNPFTTAVYVAFVADGKIKQEYIDQVQFSMWVTGRETWHFANHDPRVKNYILHSIVIERDEAKMKLFDDAVAQFIHDMDKKLAIFDNQFGDQWK